MIHTTMKMVYNPSVLFPVRMRVCTVHQNYVGGDAEKEPFFVSVVVTDANNHSVPQYRAILWRKTVSTSCLYPGNVSRGQIMWSLYFRWVARVWYRRVSWAAVEGILGMVWVWLAQYLLISLVDDAHPHRALCVFNDASTYQNTFCAIHTHILY